MIDTCLWLQERKSEEAKEKTHPHAREKVKEKKMSCLFNF
jgi:hypothetical protein